MSKLSSISGTHLLRGFVPRAFVLRVFVLRGVVLAVLALLVPSLGFAQSSLLRDIETQALPPFVKSSCEHGALSFLGIWDPVTGTELWRSDGTSAGTTLLKDISLGATDGYLGGCTYFQDEIFFVGTTGPNHQGLWKTDGSAEGTVLVKEIGVEVNPTMIVVNGVLFFAANDGAFGRELWRSDGTAEGTFRLTDINPGDGNSLWSTLGSINGWVVFVSDDGVRGAELSFSDGTPGGTVIHETFPGVGSGEPRGFTTFNNKLYFLGRSSLEHFGLYATTGPGSVELIHDIGLVQGESIAVLGGNLLLSGRDTEHGVELWISDGSAAGTRIFADMNVGAAHSYPSNFHVVGNNLLFTAETAELGIALFRLDDTFAPPQLVRDFDPVPPEDTWDSSGGFCDYFFDGVAVNGAFYFYANDGTHGCELWKSDGSSTPPQLFDLQPGPDSSEPFTLSVLGNKLFFHRQESPTSSSQITPLVLDSTTDSVETFIARDGVIGTVSSEPELVGEINGKVIFSARTRELGRQVWATDGTPEGTIFLADVSPDSYPALAKKGYQVGSQLVFTIGNRGTDLWRTDGTPGGTQILFSSPLCSNCGTNLAKPEGAYAYAYLRDDQGRRGLYRTDGTLAGTALVTRVGGGTGQAIDSLTAIGSSLFFASGGELWTSDGSAEGTHMVKDLVPGSGGANVRNLAGAPGLLFFVATTPETGTELFKSDGTADGTVLVRDIVPGTGSSSPAQGVMHNGKLYFSALTPESGSELWVSDGTAGGTVMLRDIKPGAEGSNPTVLGSFAGKLYFRAVHATFGRELWRTEGTPGTTTMVNDLNPGIENGDPFALTTLRDNLAAFRATSTETGAEFYTTDGSDAGTGLAYDLNPGRSSSDPEVFGIIGSKMIFAATMPVAGREVLAIDMNNCDLAPGAVLTCQCLRPDVDQDGVIDCEEECPSDPSKLVPGVCGCGVADVDLDGDTVYDCVDMCPTDGGKSTPGQCGCGIADVDTDLDSVIDCLDMCPTDGAKSSPGVCGCGVSDGDSDGDGVIDCVDECPSDGAKTSPGTCGCGEVDFDTNGDGVVNCSEEPRVQTITPTKAKIKVKKKRIEISASTLAGATYEFTYTMQKRRTPGSKRKPKKKIRTVVAAEPLLRIKRPKAASKLVVTYRYIFPLGANQESLASAPASKKLKAR